MVDLTIYELSSSLISFNFRSSFTLDGLGTSSKSNFYFLSSFLRILIFVSCANLNFVFPK
ncbi:hypothetical protein A6J42_10455 [Leptospira interrogans serovar Copenhageni]|nr:hypothetical protein A6J42_10455 [Leptospira interrogans serovar Copenhageni]KAA5551369.1 hypothetical protein F3G11_07760 [Leptospira interrogans serovar Copenhageni]NUL43055.1 hypothetical protein [Leptospira interrogans serovar Copenhageni]QOI48284.1 hypothetical protein Lepto898_17270 [Leptospira interrogans serovar Icterohaemorrhagiae]WPM74104.1 hypothetical protein FYB70_17265 [Leptospira interrogans serovar Icterohaemorrhagiae]